MAKQLLVLAFLCLAAASPLPAAESAACTDPAWHWYAHSAAELRTLADACASDEFSELNYHRAYYKDLIEEANTASELIDYSRSSSRSYFSVYVTYIVLLEQLAPQYFPDRVQQVEFLNEEYEVNNEIAELWLRGYENLAARLDRLQSEY